MTKKTTSLPGAPVLPTLHLSLEKAVFGDSANVYSNKSSNSFRDILHLDQAQANDVDYFVTNDKTLKKANMLFAETGRNTRVVLPSELIGCLMQYFENTENTNDIEELRDISLNKLPVRMGSNDGLDFCISCSHTNELIFSVHLHQYGLTVECNIFDSSGRIMQNISNGQEFRIDDVRLNCSFQGPGPIFIGDKNIAQFSFQFNKKTILAGRATRNGRFLINRLSLKNSKGEDSVEIIQESLYLTNAHFSNRKIEDH